jgi:membrane-associated phospholipid phosphatase
MQNDTILSRTLNLRVIFIFMRSLLVSALVIISSFADANAQAQPSGAQAAFAALPDAPQPQPSDPTPQYQPDDVTVRNSLHIFFHDEAAIWTSPARIRPHDLKWLVPFVLASGAAIATDHRAQSQLVSKNPAFNNDNIYVSDGLVSGLIATPVLIFAKGQFGQDEHAREAGILGGEAMANGVVVEQVLKLVTWRERPTADSARGRFFQSSAGPNASFPSAHCTVAWSAASAVAAEYPNLWTQAAVYSAATGVSLTRVLGRQHFPSDVIVGATAGWLIGHYVVKHHHAKAGDRK